MGKAIGKSDPKDLRKGEKEVTLTLPRAAARDGSTFVWCVEDKNDPKSYKNVFELKKLPEAVRVGLGLTGSVRWAINVDRGLVEFVREVHLESELDMPTKTKPEAEFKPSELAEKLIDACELDLREPEQHRPEGLTDDEWDEVKDIAHEMINGRM